MRITSIQNNIYFTGRKAGNKQNRIKRLQKEPDYSYLIEETHAKRHATNRFDFMATSINTITKAEPAVQNVGIIKPDKPMPFEKTHANFVLDDYQKEAIENYKAGKSTIVSAPTGTGKTLIAEYAIKDALDNNEKIIYLSPLKALSNEKYTDFCKLFGTYDKEGNLLNTDNIGLMTGDTTINPDAPVLVMTTEIYRNSLLTNSDKEIEKRYKNYSGVIYDEFHYLADKSRGTVWEEAVMNTPKHMKQLMLSATASNSKNILGWLGELNNEIDTHLVNVPESERHVPLREAAVTVDSWGKIVFEPTKTAKISTYKLKENLTERQQKAIEEMKNLLELDSDDEAIEFILDLQKNNSQEIKASALSDKLVKNGIDKDKADSISLVLSKKHLASYKDTLQNDFSKKGKTLNVINALNKKHMTPALFYIFSKRGCNAELENAAANGDNLLTKKESAQVEAEVQNALDKGIFLGSDFTDTEYAALKKGYAVHHAGRLPAYKSLIEKLAKQGLVKVCFATETLIAGINMPFRTTVFTSLEKTDDSGEIQRISPNTFKQGAGRAGRRGKDDVGNVIVMPRNIQEYQDYLDLTRTNDTSIKSQYNISYATLLSDKVLNDVDGNTLKTLAAYQGGSKFVELDEKTKNKFELLSILGYIKQENDGTYTRSKKGEIAKKVFGINELFMSELLYNPEYLKDCTSVELTALCAAFADVKDEEPERNLKGDFAYFDKRINQAFDLAGEIDNFELFQVGEDEKIKYSTNLVPYIAEFANAPQEKDEALCAWSDIMTKLKTKNLIVHEGDFLRVINGTIDLLKLIEELSPDENIQDEARKAIKNLKKPPLTDIFDYELNQQENA